MVFSVVSGKVYSDNTGTSLQIPVLMTPQGPVRQGNRMNAIVVNC